MRRFWLLAFVLLTACGSATTEKPAGASPGGTAPSSTSTPSRVTAPSATSTSSPVTAGSLPPRCKLPLIESNISGGFLVFPDGTYASDPGSYETFDFANHNLRTTVDPAFHGPQDYSMDQPVFDARSSRWLPVPRASVSPDGSSYVYSQYLYPPNASATSLPPPIGSMIRLVTIGTGEDKVIYQGSPYDVVGWQQEGVYLRRPCTDANCQSGGGLWLLPGSGAPQLVAAPPAQVSSIRQVPMWSALGGGAAWALAADPTDGNLDRLLRHDLMGGTETVWFSRPRSTWMSLLGIDSGAPMLAVRENSSMGVWLISGRDTAQLLMTMPIVQTSGPGGGQLAPADPEGSPVHDSYGTWLGTNGGVLLRMSDGTVRKMSDKAGAVAGSCS